METLSSGARVCSHAIQLLHLKYYVRTYSLVKRLSRTLAGRAMLIINKDSCIV